MLFHGDHAKKNVLDATCHRVEVWADIKQIQATATVDAAGWNTAALRRELNN
jgi:glutamyl-tRNA reductase